MFQTKVVDKIKTHIFSVTFFEKRAGYERVLKKNLSANSLSPLQRPTINDFGEVMTLV